MSEHHPTRVLVTGATGFVGRALVETLATNLDYQVVALVRRESRFGATVQIQQAADFHQGPEVEAALKSVDTVVHCAARVHVMAESQADPQAEYDRVNVAATLALARRAHAVGVRRFIFVSSIKVNGEGTKPGEAYQAEDAPAPIDPYGISKAAAEQQLLDFATQSGLQVVIIRPVLVYGPGVKANFLSMMRWLDRGVVLPFGAIDNRRSLVALDNLVDLIVTCIHHPAAAGQRFLVSDGEDLSTTQLLRRMAVALGRPARLIPVPSWILSCAATALGRKALSQRLCGSLTVDICKTRELLNWTPPVTVEQALRKTAQHYKDSKTA